MIAFTTFRSVTLLTVTPTLTHIVRTFASIITVSPRWTLWQYFRNIKTLYRLTDPAFYCLVSYHRLTYPIWHIPNLIPITGVKPTLWITTGCLVTTLSSLYFLAWLKGSRFLEATFLFIVVKSLLWVRGIVRPTNMALRIRAGYIMWHSYYSPHTRNLFTLPLVIRISAK